MERRARLVQIGLRAAALATFVVLAGCEKPATGPTTVVWLFGTEEPRFDPDGPPNPGRWALERLLTRGLVEQDSAGRIVPAAAARIEVPPDSLIYTFRLRPNLTFTDGTPCRSNEFRRALEGGLAREDHSTRVWLLASLQGVERVRAGRALPPIGIDTPDESTLVMRLSRADPFFLAKLALPGVSDPWKDRGAASWGEAVGVGPYRVVESDPGRGLRVVRAASPEAASLTGPAPDSLWVRFRIGVRHARSLMRVGRVDLLWPLPPRLLDEPLPSDYRRQSRDASPPRRLLLVMRADLPPTSKQAARRALVHGLNRGAVQRDLAPVAEPLREWLPGAGPFDFPRLDGEEVAQWLRRGRLGSSFHVAMAYDSRGVGAEIARAMQDEWARHSIYVELRPLSTKGFSMDALRGRSHLLLIEAQSLIDDPAADLAALVMPLRGPAVGTFRTGWRTRDFDRWISTPGSGSAPPTAEIQWRLEQEMVALPLVRLPWVWVERRGSPPPAFHPRFGPRVDTPVTGSDRNR